MNHINTFINKNKTESLITSLLWLFFFTGPGLTVTSTIIVLTTVVLTLLAIYTFVYVLSLYLQDSFNNQQNNKK